MVKELGNMCFYALFNYLSWTFMDLNNCGGLNSVFYRKVDA